MAHSATYVRILACVLAVGGVGKAKGQHVIFNDNYDVSFTFMDAPSLEQTRMPAAHDGIYYWSSSGGSPGGLRLAQYDGATGDLIATYAPNLDFRSIFTDAAGNLYARQFNSPIIYQQTDPGTFATYVTLIGGPLDQQSAVVLNSDGTEYIAMAGGTVSQWDSTGTFLGTVALLGYGTMFGEQNYPNNRGIAAAGGYWLTYSNRMLSAWDDQGNRVDTTELLNAGTGFDSHFSFSYANGMVFIVDGAGGVWRGYNVGLSP